MAFWILPPSGKVIVRQLVWGLMQDKLGDPLVLADIKTLNAAIKTKAGDSIPVSEVSPALLGAILVIPDDLFDYVGDKNDELVKPATTPDDFTPETYNEYLTVEVLLPEGGELKRAQVLHRKHLRRRFCKF